MQLSIGGRPRNRALIRRMGEITGTEAHALGYGNVYAPIMDVCAIALGRCEESYGEDPFLVSELAIQMVKGIQAQGVVSTMKHFGIYSITRADAKAMRTDPHVSPRERNDSSLAV